MRLEAVISTSGLILNEIFNSKAGADRILERFFRKNRWGPAERAAVGDAVFGVLRHKRRLDALFAEISRDAPGFKELAACAMADAQGWSPQRLAEISGQPLTGIGEAFTPQAQLDPARRHSLPDWLWNEFENQWGATESQELARSLNDKPVDIRVNRRLAARDAVRERLAAVGIDSEPTPYSVDGLRISGRHSLTETASFKAGEFEIQDEGSQLLSPLLRPRPGAVIIDLCAGGGGKSLHLADIMGDRGRVVATDIDSKRLKRLATRQRRAGVRSIQAVSIKHEGDPKLKRWTGTADGVLVDAPCSGTGTLRRNPEIKWRLGPEELFVYQQRQGALLDAGARLLKKGGQLVYATCSLMRAENRDVIEGFQKANPAFKVIAPPEEFEGLLMGGPFLTLLPHRTGTDGFFAAVLQKMS